MKPPETVGDYSILMELEKEDLIALLMEKDRALKEIPSRGLDDQVKEVWTAITRLRDRVDSLEAKWLESSNISFNYWRSLEDVVYQLVEHTDMEIQVRGEIHDT